MTTTRKTNDREGPAGGEIRLRQTAQVTLGDQTRTLEIALTLAVGASDDDISEAVRQAEIGIAGISDRLDQQIARLRDAGPVVQSLPMSAPPPALPAPATAMEPVAPPAAQPDAAAPVGHGAAPKPTVSAHQATTLADQTTTPESAPSAGHAPAPEAAPPADRAAMPDAHSPAPQPTTPANHAAPPMTMAGFLKAADALGFKSDDILTALGRETFTGLDFADALVSLRAIAATRPAPGARSFAEEIAAYRAADDDGAADYAIARAELGLPPLDDPDEPDFGPSDAVADDNEFVAEPAPAPDPVAARRQALLDRLRGMRGIRADGAPPTKELQQSFLNIVANPLGKDTTQALIKAIWNPPAGERLSTPRMRALIELGHEEDDFDQAAELMIALAAVPAPVED